MVKNGAVFGRHSIRDDEVMPMKVGVAFFLKKPIFSMRAEKKEEREL